MGSPDRKHACESPENSKTAWPHPKVEELVWLQRRGPCRRWGCKDGQGHLPRGFLSCADRCWVLPDKDGKLPETWEERALLCSRRIRASEIEGKEVGKEDCWCFQVRNESDCPKQEERHAEGFESFTRRYDSFCQLISYQEGEGKSLEGLKKWSVDYAKHEPSHLCTLYPGGELTLGHLK